MIPLNDWGFGPFFQNQISEADERSFIVGRIINEEKGGYKVVTAKGICNGQLSGRFAYRCQDTSDYPAVGDWILAFGDDVLMIERVLERRSALTRRKTGASGETQILAANLDLVFIVTSLNNDLNVRRLERYMVLANGAGIRPVIVLSKCDLKAGEQTSIPESPFPGTECIAVSAVTGQNMDALRAMILPGATAALVGSSGVGKSTLLNRMADGMQQAVQEVRADDDRGRHTTTSRSLFLLPGGGVLADTPGIREVGMTDDDEGIHQLFLDLDELARSCRFSNCEHQTEPGCALLAAVEDGTLEEKRIRSWQKLKREQAHQEAARDKRAASNSKKRFRTIAKDMRRFRKSSVKI